MKRLKKAQAKAKKQEARLRAADARAEAQARVRTQAREWMTLHVDANATGDLRDSVVPYPSTVVHGASDE
jgi:hypothetical protein